MKDTTIQIRLSNKRKQEILDYMKKYDLDSMTDFVLSSIEIRMKLEKIIDQVKQK